jgi:hypothetical protein
LMYEFDEAKIYLIAGVKKDFSVGGW